MYQYDDPTAVSVLPTPAAPGTPGYFTDGSPGGGVPATILRSDFMNMIQAELLNILTAAGVAPSKTTYNQLLGALSLPGVFDTPAQFDVSTKAATTAFLNLQGEMFGGIATIGSATTLTAAAHIGKLLVFYGTASFACALPAASACPAGTTLTFIATGSGVITLNRAGSDTISMGSGTSLVLNSNDTLSLTSNGSNTWYPGAGSVSLPYSSGFASSIGTNGYKRTIDSTAPKGYTLEQWGSSSSSGTSAGNAAISFPVSFPTACKSLVALVGGSGAAAPYTLQTGTPTTSGASLTAVVNSTITSGIAFYWKATGY